MVWRVTSVLVAARAGLGVSRMASSLASVPIRPRGAVGTFLRICTVNDVYKIGAYPSLSAMVGRLKSAAESLDCRVISTLNGDFLSPCVLTSLDGGKGMAEVLDLVPVDYCVLGNHEFDVGSARLRRLLKKRVERVVVLNSNIDEGTVKKRVETIRVGERRVLLCGLATDDLSIYRPGGDAPRITSPLQAAAELLVAGGDEECDAVIPLTHQTMAQDEALARLVSAHGKTPVILGGHDHEVGIRVVDDVAIVKVGMDAERCGVVDVYWDEAGTLRVALSLVCLDGEEREAAARGEASHHVACRRHVDRQLRLLETMAGTELLRLPPAAAAAWSSERVRFADSPFASFLLSVIKKRLHGADVVMLQAGAFRGHATYADGVFTWGHLASELAFETEMALVDLPGRVIIDTVIESRRPAAQGVEAPEFLHLDRDWTVKDGETILNMDPDATYTVAIYQLLLQGMNDIKPLVDYVKTAGLDIPDLECCYPAKNLVLEAAVCDAWQRIVDHNDGDLSRAFKALDLDNSGAINRSELRAYVAALDPHAAGAPCPPAATPGGGGGGGGEGLAPPRPAAARDSSPSDVVDASVNIPLALVSMMFDALDTNQDDVITYDEFAGLAHSCVPHALPDPVD